MSLLPSKSNDLRVAQKQVKRLQEQVASLQVKLREALWKMEKYGGHLNDCGLESGGWDCTCGWVVASREAHNG